MQVRIRTSDARIDAPLALPTLSSSAERVLQLHPEFLVMSHKVSVSFRVDSLSRGYRGESP